jgi:hypothetical protein
MELRISNSAQLNVTNNFLTQWYETQSGDQLYFADKFPY